LAELKCKTIECLHNKSPEELLESVPYKWRAFNQDLPTKDEKQHHWLVRDGNILTKTDNETTDQIPFVAGAPAEVDASVELFSYLDWNDTSKYKLYLESKLGSFDASLPADLTDRYFRPEFTHWQQFASLLSDVRTICPLYRSTLDAAQSFRSKQIYFYVTTQRRHTDIGFVADASSDIAAIMGLYDANTIEEKNFVENMETLFYGFARTGKFPEDQIVTNAVHLVDEHIQRNGFYPNCDFWIQHGFYPNYTRVD